MALDFEDKRHLEKGSSCGGTLSDSSRQRSGSHAQGGSGCVGRGVMERAVKPFLSWPPPPDSSSS